MEETNPLVQIMSEIVEERPDLALPVTLKSVFPALPNNVDLNIPEGYTFSPEHGIKIATAHAIEPVYGFVIIPTALIKANENDQQPMVLLYFWDDKRQQWERHKTLVDYQTLTSTRDITKINKIMQIVVDEQQRAPLARYFADFWKANDRLQVLPIIVQKQRCGWYGTNEFYPFLIKNEESNVKANNKTLIYAIGEAVKSLPKGNMAAAKQVIEELQSNPVFAVCLAGCLASVVVPLIPGKLDENIGIDVAGKTSSGKTTIEKLSVDLVYGLGDLLKLSWAKLKEAGIWNMARVINNLPFILDDTHRMKEQHAGIPHDLINGQEGPKSIQTEDGWEGRDPNSSQYEGTAFFNGEIPTSRMAPKDSAGIYGRIFIIEHPPFPKETTGSEVESLKKRGLDNAGHFAKPWIEHLVKLGADKIYQQVEQLNNIFDCTEKDALYGRLATKAQVLIFCLREFNQLFGTKIDEDKMIELLKQSMDVQTENVNVADKQMALIVEKVFEQLAGRPFNEKDCILLNYDNGYPLSSRPDVCYCKESHLIIKGTTLEEILKEGNYVNAKAVCAQLQTAGYLEKSSATKLKYPPVEGLNSDQARIQGFKFLYKDFEKFIPKDEDDGTKND
ncbi:DUF927 domain-containing protein [Paenibacillus sp. URB8-2]|uniref:DUF927 domain-containing protein n=1 Tax=Paenibacillus sp. URB8-2 TaxID=2741301 RepID=UPI0015C27601|nr:DUF927 domain-containing protein [Paenibacillus sp. URB8-2]BCG56753.1 hypothetical protein PUR_01780 [Paenibacillus sp. URB8-2]